MDINTFAISGISKLKFKWPNIQFNLNADYINNSDVTIPIDAIVAKVYQLDGNIENEIAVSSPNLGYTLTAKKNTKISIPMNFALPSIGSLLKSTKLRVRVWITVQGITIEDVQDLSI